VLANVARETGSAGVLAPVWSQIVGPTLAGVSAPARLEGKTLVIRCRSAAWATELGGQRAQWLARLEERLGKKTVDALVFEVA
jgi:predicted nucleic acid-binding Zn ribbon protein